MLTVIGSGNAGKGVAAAMDVLRGGGSAVDAVETAIRVVEADPEDRTVGYGGYPNVIGEVELDAAIMEGRALYAGAVGALKGFKHPISVARRIMSNLPHVMLVGEGAARFAAELGAERAELLTPEARKVWQERLKACFPDRDPRSLVDESDLSSLVRITTDPEKAKGTVNVLARDVRGDLCAGVSTSGWAWKYPGRLGDSPVIGAGLYADNRHGAAACVGQGELAIRLATAHGFVTRLAAGNSLDTAGTSCIRDILELESELPNSITIVALDAKGEPAGFSSRPDRKYVVMTDGMAEPDVRDAVCP